MSDIEIREGLTGNLFRFNGQPIPEGMLTKHEAGELIRRAGRQAGFRVETEWKVPGGRIDWVWFEPDERNHPSVAFEVEGVGVYSASGKPSLDSDRKKLSGLQTSHRYIVLFHVDHNYGLKPGLVDDAKERVIARISEPSISVLYEYDLWHNQGIEKIAEATRDPAL